MTNAIERIYYQYGFAAISLLIIGLLLAGCESGGGGGGGGDGPGGAPG